MRENHATPHTKPESREKPENTAFFQTVLD
jgi:hypothetical protein